MMRRRHKKSRKGCLECKRRHIKCDETRPRCINCSTAERECPYPLGDVSPAEGSPIPSGPGSGSGSSQGFGPDPSAFSPAPDHEPTSMVNMVHAELLHHFMVDPETVYPGIFTARDIVIQQALREPYLMHQLLAWSARHLSIVHPQNAHFYHNQAIQLQTHALSLFNSIDVNYFDASIERRVHAFIFSGFLGIHSLCDTLHHRDEDFLAFHARYVAYLRLHRGVFHMTDGHWEEIRQTAIKPLIENGERWYLTPGQGPECDDIRARIKLAGFDPETLDGLLKAIDLIQSVFDGRPPSSRVHTLLSWGTMAPLAFIEMVIARRPEALVILAYYFLAIHACRNIWVVGDSGQYIFTSIVNHLGPEWSAWLEKPCQLMRESLEKDALSSQQTPTGLPGISS